MSQQKIGKYIVERALGRGAMGTVYLVMDPVLDVRYALKVMNPGELDENLRRRFLKEARSIARLNHPNIVSINYADEDGNRPYIVMEYVEGEDLKELIDRRVFLPFRQRLEIVIKICTGLHYAHQREVLHRDIKPANVRITPDGNVKIVDFGLARLQSSELTRTGQPMGTPYYMAPEQARGRSDLDRRSDLFSVGIVLYELLANRKPFDYAEDANWPSVLLTNMTDPHVPLTQTLPGCGEELGEIIDRVLAKDREARYGSCEELAVALKRVQCDLPRWQQELKGRVAALETEFEKCRAETARRKILDLFDASLFAVHEVTQDPDQTLVAGLEAQELTEDYGLLLAKQQFLKKRLDEIGEKFKEVLPLLSSLEDARRQLERGEVEACFGTVDQLLQKSPTQARVLRLRQECLDAMSALRLREERRQRLAAALTQAQAALEQGNFSLCLQATSRVLQLEPENQEAMNLKGLALESMERRRRVQEWVAEARAYFKAGDYQACSDSVNKGLEVEPQHPELIEFKEKARRELDIAEQIRKLLAEAKRQIEERNYSTALERIEEGLRLAPSDKTAQDLQEECFEALERQQQIDQRVAEAVGLHRAGDDEGALQAVEEGLELDAGNTELRTLKERSLHSLEKKRRVRELVARGQQQRQDQDLSALLKTSEELLAAEPANTQALEWERWASNTRQRLQKVEQLLAEARRLYEEDNPEACFRVAAEALELSPEHDELKQLRDKSQLALERPSRIRKLVEDGEGQLRQRDHSGVLKTVAELLGLDPEHHQGLELQRLALEGLDRQRKVESLLSRARVLERAEDYERCLGFLTQAAMLDPEHPGLLSWHEQIAKKANEAQKVRELLEHARTQLQVKAWDAAQDALEELLALKPGQAQAVELRLRVSEGREQEKRFKRLQAEARHAHETGDYEAAHRVSAEALILAPHDEGLQVVHRESGHWLEKQRQVGQLLESAIRHLQEEEYDQVAQTCATLLGLDPKHAQALELHRIASEAHERLGCIKDLLDSAQTAFQRQDYEESYQLAAQGLELSPTQEDLLQLRDQAAKALEKPRKLKALLERARQQVEVKDFDGATQTVADLLSLEPQHSQALAWQQQAREGIQKQRRLKELQVEAEAYGKRGDFAACIDVTAQALKLDPANLPIRQLHEQARQHLEKHRELKTLFNIALDQRQKQEPQALLRTVERLLALEPEHSEALELQQWASELLARNRKLEELLTSARGYFRARDYEACCQAAEEGIQLESTHAELLELHRNSSQIIEEKRRMHALWEQAQQHQQRREWAAELQALFEILKLNPADAQALARKPKAESALQLQRQLDDLVSKVNAAEEAGDDAACLRLVVEGLCMEKEHATLKEIKVRVERRLEKQRRLAELLQQANQRFEREQFSAALELLQELLIQEPKHEQALRLQRLAFDSLSLQQKIEQALAGARGSMKAGDFQGCTDRAAQGLALAPAHAELKRLHEWAQQGLAKLENERQLLGAANEQWEAGDASAVLGTLQELLAIAPGHPVASKLQRQVLEALDLRRRLEELVATAQGFYRSQEYEQCLSICQKALELDPQHPEIRRLHRSSEEIVETKRRVNALMEKAGEKIERQDYSSALDSLRMLLEIEPKHVEGQQLQRYANEALERMQKLDLLLRQAQGSYRSGDLAACQEFARQGLELQPGHSELKQLKDWAQQAVEKATQTSALLVEARGLREREDFPGVLQVVQRLLEVDPGHLQGQELEREALKNIERKGKVEDSLAGARGYLQSGDYDASHKMALEGLELDPTHAELQRVSAEALRGIETLGKEKVLLENAAQQLQNRDTESVFKTLQELLALTPGHPEGLELHRRATEQLTLRRKVKELLAAARGYQRARKFEDCIRVCEQGLQLEPDNVELAQLQQDSQVVLQKRQKAGVLLQTAREHFHKRDYGEALDSAKTLLMLDPKHQDGLDLQERVQDAVARQERIDALLSEARQLQEAGQYEACLKVAAQGLSIDATHKELKQLREWAKESSEREAEIQALLQKGEEELQRHQFAHALQTAQAVLSLSSNHSGGQTLQREALKHLERQGKTEDLLAAARGYLQSKDYEGARKVALDALELEPGHTELKQALDSAEKGLQQQARAAELLQEAQKHLEKRDTAAVFRILDELLFLSPGNPKAQELQRSAMALREGLRKFEELLAAARGFDKAGDLERCYQTSTQALNLQPGHAELQELQRRSRSALDERRVQEDRQAQIVRLEDSARAELRASHFRAALRAAQALLELEAGHADALVWRSQAKQGLAASYKKVGQWIAAAASVLVATGLASYLYFSVDTAQPIDGEWIVSKIVASSVPQSEIWPESYPRPKHENKDPGEESARIAATQAQGDFRRALEGAARDGVEKLVAGGFRRAKQLGNDAEQKMKSLDFAGARAGFEAASAEINSIVREARQKKTEAAAADDENDQQRVRDVLDHYRSALVRRDLLRIKQLWPGISSGDETRLKDYFNAASITASVEITSLKIFDRQRAQVTCRQQVNTDRGNFSTRPNFTLEKRGDSWQIVRKLD